MRQNTQEESSHKKEALGRSKWAYLFMAGSKNHYSLKKMPYRLVSCDVFWESLSAS